MQLGSKLFLFGFDAFRRKDSVFGVSYLLEKQLEVVFAKRAGDQWELLGEEHMTRGEPLSEQAISDFQSRLSLYRYRSPVWIHLIDRSAAFVKVFTLTGISTQELEAAIAKRIPEETPYHAEELSYHYSLEGSPQAGAQQVVMFGISKAVLRDHLGELDRLGLIPDRVLLSTDVLLWLYRTRIVPMKRESGTTVFIHLFPKQAELLYLENGCLLQSRWIAQEASEHGALGDTIEAAAGAFQREFRRVPKAALVLEPGRQRVKTSLAGFSLATEPVSLWPDLAISPLVVAALEAHHARGVFNFTLPEIEMKRKREANTRERVNLLFSMLFLSFSIFLMAFTPVLANLGEVAWLRLRLYWLSDSIREVKTLRAQALQIQAFREKKSFPVQLLVRLREAIPTGVLVKELDYKSEPGIFLIRGVAGQETFVEQMANALSHSPLFQSVTLERVQAQQDEQQGTLYHFEIKGRLGGGAEP